MNTIVPSESPAVDKPLSATERAEAYRHARYAADFGTLQDPSFLGMAYMRLANEAADLRRALGLSIDQQLCTYTNFEEQSCLKPSGHTEVVGEGWNMGLGWTSRGRVGWGVAGKT